MAVNMKKKRTPRIEFQMAKANAIKAFINVRKPISRQLMQKLTRISHLLEMQSTRTG